MKPRGEVVINLTVDGRSLLAALLIVCLLAVGYSALADSADVADTNSQAAAPPALTGVPQKTGSAAPSPQPEGSDVAATINGESVPVSAQGAPAGTGAQAMIAAAPGALPRHFYLTQGNYRPNQALTACGAGYHMASLWEILDVSNLIYDYNHPAAHTKSDSGYGPPAYWNGWVRTGWTSSTSNTAGTGNCNNWTSTSAGHYGVSVRLAISWESAPGDIFVWDATSFACSLVGPVWCVADVHTVHIPSILMNR